MSRSDLVLRDGRIVPTECLQVSFARGGGPGGQHVNKTETKVDLRLDLEAAAPVLGDRDVARIRERLGNRLDADGRLHVTASEHRSQHQNLEAALARLASLIAGALVRQKRRIATKPTRGSKQRRLDGKRQRGDIKKGRQKPRGDF
ncbi:MAG: aminoacyl-tRNA hydrolase [Planctomycetes bacterium]|nr:aminoacyl-tRNA hydrolase [Planctomycetota bacterium]